ncbi:TolC family protein [Rubripirellula lacrimiformis]|uniref:TolC family protein n=1 Tax=Rubripirellula lacrimiformis TaxID=1930273 RepID=UPI001FE2E6CB|nr:efflux transporter outer membrane subunit [Rubripirellula lacrimiformis]
MLLILPACSIPQLRRASPAAARPESFHGTTNLEGEATTAEDSNEFDSLENSAHMGWYEFFEDPMLAGLIDQAIVGNQELRILAQEIQIANNEVQARSGEYLPFVTFGAGAGIEKPGQYTREGAVEDQLEVRPGQAFPEPLPDFLVATNLRWELDIWRKLRNAKDAACLRYLGTRDGQNYVVTRMVAEVAENYYELLALDNQLATLDTTIELQQKSLETAKAMKEQARGTELAVQRFQAEVHKNESEKLIIQQQIVEAENRINFLLGRYPQRVDRTNVEYIDLNLHALSIGVPSQLLQNRSDIRQAERELGAAGLDIKVARARFYPSLALNAGVGYRAFDAKYLFSTPESLIYNVAGDLVAPLINKKAIKADYRSANAKQIQVVYNYQRTVLNAFTEVINYMAKVDNYGKSIEIKKQQLASLEGSVDSATKLFQNARGEYLDVLLSQRDMMESKMILIETKQEQLAATVKAYQALGGGGTLGG